MSGLIDELKHEHIVITTALGKAWDLGVNTAEGKELLFSTKNLLLAHLKKEDIELYPPLREAAKKSSELKESLDSYIEEMQEISKAALAFFEKYESGGDEADFSKDYRDLYKVLTVRILNEEAVLYRKFEKL